MGVEYTGQIGYGFKLSEKTVARLKEFEAYDDYGNVEEYLWTLLPDTLEVLVAGNYWSDDAPFEYGITVKSAVKSIEQYEGPQFMLLWPPVISSQESNDLWNTRFELEQGELPGVGVFYAGLVH